MNGKDVSELMAAVGVVGVLLLVLLNMGGQSALDALVSGAQNAVIAVAVGVLVLVGLWLYLRDGG